MSKKIMKSYLSLHKSKLSLFLLILFSHLFLVVNDGNYWDGVIISHHITLGDWEFLKELFTQLGRPQTYYLIHAISFLGDNFASIYRIIVFISLCIIGYSIFNISHKALRLDEYKSWFVAAFTVSWPFYSVFVSETFLDYILAFTFFYVAWDLFFYSQRNNKQIIYFLSIILLSATCYTTNSLLVYYYGFVAILYYIQNYKLSSENKTKSIVKSFFFFAKKYWLILLIPILLYIAKVHWHTPYGLYENYNSIIFTKYNLLESLKHLADNIQHDFLYITRFISLTTIKFIWPFLLIGGGVYIYIIKKIDITKISVPFLSRAENNQAIFLLATILIISAIFPYSVVGKSAYGGVWWSWGVRHLALQPFGFALLLIAIQPYIKRKIKKDLLAFYFFTLLTFSSALIYKYINLQARAVIDFSVIQNLKEVTPPEDGAYILYDLPMDYALDSYRSYSVNYILYNAWQAEKWSGAHLQTIDQEKIKEHLWSQMASHSASSDISKKQKLSRGFNPNGCAVKVSVKVVNNMSKGLISLKYYYYKFFRSEKDLNIFLENLTHISVLPLAKLNQKNCTN